MLQMSGLIDATQRHAAASMRCIGEPTLADLFGDPMTHAVMAADHVDNSYLQALLRRARHFIALRNH